MIGFLWYAATDSSQHKPLLTRVVAMPLPNLKEDHILDRRAVKNIQCNKCKEVQPSEGNTGVCVFCGQIFGSYSCSTCTFYNYDHTGEKEYWHCDACGICRTGDIDDFFHCDECGCCRKIKDVVSCSSLVGSSLL